MSQTAEAKVFLPIPEAVHDLCRVFQGAGYRAWLVGGCVRDRILGAPGQDYDLATDATPAQVQRLFRKVIPTGIDHGTVTVLWKGDAYEVTTLRGEGAYLDGRRPEGVTFVTDLVEDLSRRDFTVNAMAYDPLTQTLTDPFGGREDLGKRRMRTVGDPETRFREDGLRPLRGARFCATLEATLDPATEQAIRPTLDVFQKVSHERVRDEWLKALRAEMPSPAFAVMARTGLLEAIFSELASFAGVTFETGNPLGKASVTGQAFFLAAVDACRSQAQGPFFALAGLIYPWAFTQGNASSRNERVSDWLSAYRFSKKEKDEVIGLLKSQLPPCVGSGSDADLRRYLHRHGRTTGRAGGILRRTILEAASALGIETLEGGPINALLDDARRAEARLDGMATSDCALTTGELAVTGGDLIQTLGLKPSPAIGQILRLLLDHVLEQPEDNQADILLALARQKKAASDEEVR